MRTGKLLVRALLFASLVYAGMSLGEYAIADNNMTCTNVDCSTAPSQQGDCAVGDACLLTTMQSTFWTCKAPFGTCVNNKMMYGSTECVGTCVNGGKQCRVIYAHCQ